MPYDKTLYFDIITEWKLLIIFITGRKIKKISKAEFKIQNTSSRNLLLRKCEGKIVNRQWYLGRRNCSGVVKSTVLLPMVFKILCLGIRGFLWKICILFFMLITSYWKDVFEKYTMLRWYCPIPYCTNKSESTKVTHLNKGAPFVACHAF